MHFNYVKKFIVSAELHEVTDDKSISEIIQAAEKMNSAEVASIITPDGKPRMLMLSAWMVHDGRNLNGAAFVAEELKKRVEEGLFRPPYGGLVDFNHDFNPIGFWYSTSYAFDPKAKKWGILAKGAVWAWRFPEVTDKLLAQMHEFGKIDVSMSVIGESDEITRNYPGFEDQFTFIIHNPVFLTTSLLDVPPADPDANGVAGTRLEEIEQFASLLSKSKEDYKMDELNALREQVAQLTTELESLRTAKTEAETKVTELLASIESLQKELDASKTSSDGLTAELETVKQSLTLVQADLEAEKTAKAALEVSLASASQTIAEIEKKYNEAEKLLQTYATAEAEAAAQAKLEARVAELPEIVRENLEQHDEKEKIFESFRNASDEEWANMKSVFSLATSDNYAQRSSNQRALLSGTNKNDQSSLSRFLR